MRAAEQVKKPTVGRVAAEIEEIVAGVRGITHVCVETATATDMRSRFAVVVSAQAPGHTPAWAARAIEDHVADCKPFVITVDTFAQNEEDPAIFTVVLEVFATPDWGIA